MRCEYKCTVCGYSYTGEEPKPRCPYCNTECPFVEKSFDCLENPKLCQRRVEI
ncbi:MAG: rubredoxin-like domain-containing protein [Candidatus Hydrothermarchaeales archaeon]